MAEDSYTLPNAWELADRRLELLELEHDPYTIRRARDHVREGAACLEAGAGRGSIAQWLCEAVGPSGRVAAVDLDARFLRLISAPNLEVHELDLVAGDLPPGQFDFVHARLLLMHLPERDALLARLIEKVAPGGAILCEEYDVFPVLGTTEGAYQEAWSAFGRAMASKGVSPTWIRTVPARMEALGLAEIRTDVDVPLFRGGSREAEFWQLTWRQTFDMMVASGVNREPLEAAIRLLDEPQRWFYGPAMVAVSARHPRHV